jgi:hypothetical protein
MPLFNPEALPDVLKKKLKMPIRSAWHLINCMKHIQKLVRYSISQRETGSY